MSILLSPWKPRVYLAGPMSGYDNFNFPAFYDGAKSLRAMGFIVYNPADNPYKDSYKWEDYLKMDLRNVLNSDAIVCLPHWYESKGATFEVYIANTLSKPILNYKTMLPIHPSDLPKHTFFKHQPKPAPKTEGAR